jgi:L-fuconolactonase
MKLMKTFPVIDTHLHIWDTNKFRYPWLDDILQLNRPYLLEEYYKAAESFNIEQMVFVQCETEFSQYKQEADWVTELAKNDKRITGIAPWAPLEKGENARAEIEALAANPLVKGIRRIIQFEEDPEFCLRPDFVKGVQMLADYSLHFEITIAHQQFSNTIKMVEQCPQVRFMLDHIGKPNIKNQQLDPWRSDIKKLSEFSNVYCKISHITTVADHQNWKVEDLRPFVDHVIQCFGFERLCFAGDWPVVELTSTYQTWVETFINLLSGTSETEKNIVFYENAKEFYRL